MHFAIDDAVIDCEHLAGAFDQAVHAARDDLRIDLRTRLLGEEIVEALLLVDRARERRDLPVVERQLADLLGELLEAAVDARVVDGELGIVQHRDLLRDALDRRDAIDQRAAGARRLRGVEDGAAAKAGEALGIPGGIGQRTDERDHHQREAGEEQSQK